MALVSLVLGLRANAQVESGWLDVCTDENYQTADLQEELCPPVFTVSTLAFNPLYPRIDSHVTLILQPSMRMASVVSEIQYVYIQLPGLTALGSLSPLDASYRQMTLTPNNPVAIGQDPAKAYNTEQNPVFDNPGYYFMPTGDLRLTVIPGKAMAGAVDTEIIVCCFKLPLFSPPDSTAYRIWGPTSLGVNLPSLWTIQNEPIKSSPFIDPGYQWEYFQVEFDPPVSMSDCVMMVTFRSANDISDSARIIFHAPGIQRVNGETGPVAFSTAMSPSQTDWLLFNNEAFWNVTASTFRLQLRDGVTLLKDKQVTLATYPDEFRLPIELPANYDMLQLEARSADGVDEVIRAAPVYQSSRVPHIRRFTYSELTYADASPGALTDVYFDFSSNRPMFAGTSIYMRLSGFRANRIEIPLGDISKNHFTGEVAKFDLPRNILEFRVNKTIYSNEQTVRVVIFSLIMPEALYENDSSLLVWTSDPGATKQPIDSSPEVGYADRRRRMVKEFIQSQVLFSPEDPNMASNITFKIRPTVPFYMGDMIILYLYGFESQNAEVPLHGPGAFRIQHQKAQWVAQDSILALLVADDEIVLATEPLEIHIWREYNFRLPDKLSLNDGILRVEGRGTFIYKEPFKKTPKIGKTKYVIASRLEFEPVVGGVLVDSIARVKFSLIFNTDILANSTIKIKLGALDRDLPKSQKSGEVRISGANAPMFIGGVGDWEQDFNMLTLKLLDSVTIFSGEEVTFFIETDKSFKLPYAMYPNDPSFKIEINEAGITPAMAFNFSTRVNMDTKRFILSRLHYNGGTVAFPDQVAELNIEFQPNVDLPPNSVIRFTLMGFTSPLTTIRIALQAIQLVGIEDLAFFQVPMQWDQLNYALDLRIPVNYKISRTLKSVIRILPEGGFKLPSFPLSAQDSRLKISVVENQLINEAPFLSSPRVVDRSFEISEFEYYPAQKETIFLLKMRLKSTVGMTSSNPIIIQMPGFINSLSKVNINIKGPNRSSIKGSMAQWNASTSTLTMQVPLANPIPADSLLELNIEEAQGFILPKFLDANDTRIRISSGGGNIPSMPVKKSPLVGNGPFPGHRFCMYQYEGGTRTLEPVCSAAADCDPPLTDPCSPEELERCGCMPKSQVVESLEITGFNLQVTDSISFLSFDLLCGYAKMSSVLGSFTVSDNIAVSEDRGSMFFHQVTSIDTGNFRICLNHGPLTFDVGFVVVRPSCPKPLVMVDGVCVEHCPKLTIPLVGNCKKDPVAGEDWDSQALMLAVRMNDPAIAPDSLADSATEEPGRRYFVYRFTYELAKLLNCDPTRIKVASLSNGSLIVNAVFTSVQSGTAAVTTGERSPRGLISLLQALQADASSQLYESSFFKAIDRSYMPEPVYVRQCDDGTYRVFCTYSGAIWDTALGLWTFLGFSVLIAFLVGLACGAVWRMDKEGKPKYDEDMMEDLKDQPLKFSPAVRVEYARSWHEGRFMGEEWQLARERKIVP